MLLMGKLTIFMAIFNSYGKKYQRVSLLRPITITTILPKQLYDYYYHTYITTDKIIKVYRVKHGVFVSKHSYNKSQSMTTADNDNNAGDGEHYDEHGYMSRPHPPTSQPGQDWKPEFCCQLEGSETHVKRGKPSCN